jgi:hypothetical protein
MLRSGDRVRCVWSHKTGRVLEPRHHTGAEPGALVLLDPFLPAWAGHPVPTEGGRQLAGLEVVYAPGDLEVCDAE